MKNIRYRRRAEELTVASGDAARCRSSCCLAPSVPLNLPPTTRDVRRGEYTGVRSRLNEDTVLALGHRPGLLVCVPGGRPSTLGVGVGSTRSWHAGSRWRSAGSGLASDVLERGGLHKGQLTVDRGGGTASQARRRIVHPAAICPDVGVRRGTREDPGDVVVLQEVAGLVALLPALLCADGGHDGGPAWPKSRRSRD
jgi:hypothetical protein